MRHVLRVLWQAARAEWRFLRHSPLFVALAVTQAVTLILLVSLFGISGAMAPTALINNDGGPYADLFIQKLDAAHHSFALRKMDRKSAWKALRQGHIVAIITIPAGFSYAIENRRGSQVVHVDIDNINTDMTEDIKRALPSAIGAFGRAIKAPDIRVVTAEHDLLPYDTGFIPYLAVSALVLAALVIAGILSGTVVAREFETGTVRLLALAPISVLVPLIGRVLATMVVSILSVGVSAVVVVYCFGITPLYPWHLVAVLLFSIVIFSCLGVALGAAVRRTLPVTTLVFGLALPMYLVSSSYEPQRFDGPLVWAVAHLSPMYYAVGIAEHAVHGLIVNPESIPFSYVILIGWAAAAMYLAWRSTQRMVPQ
jgi:ABC-2 type transport system permease protein